MKNLVAAVMAVLICLAAHPASAQMSAEVLSLNTMLTIKAPDVPVDRTSAPRKLLKRLSYESQKTPDYVKVARFIVVPGQKYTLYDCNPALSDGTKVWVYLEGDTPLTNFTASYGRSEGFTRTFVTRAQQPWPIKREENAACDLIRYNMTIAPQSEHNNLYVVFVFNKPGATTKIMLKTPPDTDDVVKTKGKRTWGDVKTAPFLLTNIPGETPVASKPTPTQPGVPPGKPDTPAATPGSGQPAGTTTPAKPGTTRIPTSGVIPEAGTTSANATVIPYNSTVNAFINKSDYDTYRFDFPGGKMRIASRGGLDIVADLWDSKGVRIARDGQDTGKDFRIEMDLPAGTYYIQIRFMYHAGEGPYTLILGNGSSAVLKEAAK